MANNQNLKPIKPGEVRNPNGYSRKRRISDGISALIDELGLDREFQMTAILMALGKKHLLKRKVKDPETGKEVWVQLTPDYAWFNALLDRVEGKVPDERQAELAEELEELRKLAESIKKSRAPKKVRKPKA